MDLYPESEATLEQAGRAIADAWTASDFESLVPLYVGGDLEPVEAQAMRAWLTRHPERAADVQAALAARQVLLGSAAAQSADGVDLWPGIRATLHAEGWIGAGRAAAREGASLSAGRPRPTRRFAASATAAAAALLCTGGLAWLLGFGEQAPGTRGAAGPVAVRGAGAVAAVPTATAGGTTEVVLVRHPVAQPELPSGVVRLGELESPPMELDAFDVDLGNYYPGTVFPIGRPAQSPASLVGGVEGTGDVFLAPPRRR